MVKAEIHSALSISLRDSAKRMSETIEGITIMTTSKSPLSTQELQALTELLFPAEANIPGPAILEERYPARELKTNGVVTRVAPSPTGFAHIGMVFISLVNRRLAHQSGGTFILRIEDTDAKREVSGATETIISTLSHYGLSPDEGFVSSANAPFMEVGNYGPYLQSSRKELYRGLVRWLVQEGKAYPCFTSEAELTATHEQQTLSKVRPGYYGRWASWRDRPLAEVRAALDKGLPYVIRFRAPGDPNNRMSWTDLVKGKISMPENDLDAVILKSDGQSLYHFAHAMDDHYMRVTHVIRGDEWLSSVPLHTQIFQAFGWQHPQYAHLPTIQKVEIVKETDSETGAIVERQSKRKLSKRKDPEANAQFYYECGFPSEAVIEYLLNLANSDFEDWRRANPSESNINFEVKLGKISSAGALADTVKLMSISREVIGRMNVDALYDSALKWAEQFDVELAKLMRSDRTYTCKCLNIERDGKKPSKRIVTWKDLRTQLAWLYDEVFANLSSFEFPEQVSTIDRSAIIETFLGTYDPADDKDVWFSKCKAVASLVGFAADTKEYKANPTAFKGSVGDVTMVLRVALAGAQQSPDLHEVMQVLGRERVISRLNRFQRGS